MEINRPQTIQEQRDFSHLSNKTPRQLFVDKLTKVAQEYVVNHKPFDYQCAKIDFDNKMAVLERESEAKYGYVEKAFVNKIDMGDLDRYGDADRFEVTREDVDFETVITNGKKSLKEIGFTVRYVCKDNEHGCSVFMTTELYNERFNKKSKKVKGDK